MRKEKNNGITLIALVITIIVLLILAGVTIATLTGDNGILTRAEEAKENMTQAEAEEKVGLAIEGLLSENLEDSSKITPEAIANQVMKDNSDVGNVRAEDSTFPTNIVFEENGIEVGVTSELKVGAFESYGGIYSEPGLEGKIAPQELFNYEPISDAEISATTYDNLPTKEARITGIKPEYCNGGGYDYENTNYEIRYEGITDTLVVPYQIEIDGEMYKVTEINLLVGGKRMGSGELYDYSLPEINTIIYPNTVRKMLTKTGNMSSDISWYPDRHYELKKVVLSDNLEIIEDNVFVGCASLENIEIPSSVKSIGNGVFNGCESLTNVIIQPGVTSIGGNAFRECSSLTNITIPPSVTSIGDRAFAGCRALTKITIPSNVTSIGTEAFYRCISLTNINIERANDGTLTGSPWGAPSTTTITWDYKGE